MLLLAGLSLDAVAVVLLVSACTKFMSQRRFRESLMHLPFLSVIDAALLATAVPAVEASLAIAILFRSRMAPLGAVSVFGIFALVSVYVMRRRLRIPCACFGSLSGDATISGRTLILNILLIAAAMFPMTAVTPSLPSLLSVTVAASVVLAIAIVAQLYSNEKRKLELRNGGLA